MELGSTRKKKKTQENEQSGQVRSVSTQPQSTADRLTQSETTRPVYNPSDSLQQAADQLQQQENKKPGAYQGSYTQQIEQLLDKVMNREPFDYDMNADPLYQQYKDQYTALGRQAMLDTIGNGAALTGGYASSAANAAGNQAYQAYLSRLNDVIPELYQAAYDRYRTEGDDIYTQLSLLQGLDESDYGRYRDQIEDFYNELSYYYGKYHDMSDDEYNRYLNDLSAWQADRNYWYGKHRDEVADSQWEQSFEYQQGRDEVADSQWQQSFEYQQNRDQVSDSQWEKNYALQQAAQEAAQSSGSGSSSTKRSASYTTVYNAARDLYEKEGEERMGAYLDRQIAAGTITEQEALDMLALLDVPKQSPIFTGQSYYDAINYANQYGVNLAKILLTEDEFRKQSNTPEYSRYRSYQDYLNALMNKYVYPKLRES